MAISNNVKLPPASLTMYTENDGEIVSSKRWEELILQENHIHPRSYHSSVIYNDVLYIYGGYEINKGILNDFKKLALKDYEIGWRDVEVTKIQKSIEKNQSNSKTTNKLYLFEFEEKEEKEKKIKKEEDVIEEPGKLHRHTAVAYNNKMYIYGGKINAFENTKNLWAFSFASNRWELIKSRRVSDDQFFPLEIDSHNAILYKDEMIVFGGYLGQISKYSNLVYSYDFQTNIWKLYYMPTPNEKKNEKPKRRANAGAVIFNDELFIYGGTNGKSKFNDLWKFDLKTLKWSQMSKMEEFKPEPRSGHIFVNYKDKLVLFGGIHDIAHEKNDILFFDLEKGIWKKIEEDSTKFLVEKMSVNEKKIKKVNMEQIFDGKLCKSIIQSPIQNQHSRSIYFIRSQSKNKSAAHCSKSDFNSTNGSEVKSSFQLKAERLRKEKHMKKMLMLQEFEVTEENRNEFSIISPTTEAMKNSIITSKTELKHGNINHTTNISMNASKNGKKLLISEEKKKFSLIKGKKPCARDGASGNLYNNKLLLFGGDRHLMTFHDLFFLSLDSLY